MSSPHSAFAGQITPGQGVVKGRIKPALTQWCLGVGPDKWSLEKVCQVAKELNVPAVEVVSPPDFPVLKKHGLICALTNSHWFVRGMCNKLHWDECIAKLTESIEANAAYGFPNVITFSGFTDTANPAEDPGPGGVKGTVVNHEEGMRNCIEGYKKIVGLAEKKKVNICLEALNSRDGAAMKGHPGYFADHLDMCVEIVKKVGSPNFKLVYDIYHIAIMDGDLIRRTHEIKDMIGHVQIAGVPGRYELDAGQEIYWPKVMQTLLDVGYDGYVGLEYIPTRDSLQSVTQAIQIIDV
jgi:hydroxypyruvate isomerase